MKVLDLFAGCGGFSDGFRQAGFEVDAAVEMWDDAVNTFRANHPATRVFEGDIRDLEPEIDASYSPGYFTVVVGGPPCQGFSMSGDRNIFDPRGQLYRMFLSIVHKLRPQVFVMENVRGLTTMKHIPYWEYSPDERKKLFNAAKAIQRHKFLYRVQSQRTLSYMEVNEFLNLKEKLDDYKTLLQSHTVSILDKIVPRILDKLGRKYRVKYRHTYGVLNSADYGVPQRRERVFLIGTRDISYEPYRYFPHETHERPRVQITVDKFLPRLHRKVEYWRTVKDAIGDLVDIPEDEEFSHIFTKHTPEMTEKIKNTRPGKSVYDNFSEAWYRLKWDETARTVKESHGGHFVHPQLDRVLTPRELARLQSFPDSFKFLGPKSGILKMIGNAVPPLLARRIAERIKTFI